MSYSKLNNKMSHIPAEYGGDDLQYFSCNLLRRLSTEPSSEYGGY